MSTTSPTLAGPPGDCCFTGFKHVGTPIGKTIDIAGVPTYITEPTTKQSEGQPKKVVLFFPDIHGPFFLNNQLIQDYFAGSGFVVLGIDYFFGDPLHLRLDEPNFDRQAWMAKAKEKAADAVPRWLKAVREKFGADSKYCAVGYCFGAPYVMDLAGTDDIVAAAFAHPAFLTEDQFTNIKKPLFLSCAETDHTFLLESRRRAEDLLVAAKAQYYIQVFSGVVHSFAVRGNPDVENERWAKEESARGIIRWFTRFTSL